jgi:hypothetical protein
MLARLSVVASVTAALLVSGLLLGAGTASAHEQTSGDHHPSYHHHHHSRHHGCVDGRDRDDLVATLSPDGSTVTVRGRRPLCHPVVLLFGAYHVPDTWDRVRFDASAVPQQLVSEARGRLVGDHVLRLHVHLPCGNVQVDLYYPPRIVTVGRHGHSGQLVKARLWHRDDCPGTADVQNIAATIPDGVLTLSTPCVPGLVLDEATSTTEPIAVTDVRAQADGWTVTVGTTASRWLAGVPDGRGSRPLGAPWQLLPGVADVTATSTDVTVTITVY